MMRCNKNIDLIDFWVNSITIFLFRLSEVNLHKAHESALARKLDQVPTQLEVGKVFDHLLVVILFFDAFEEGYAELDDRPTDLHH